MSIRKRRYPMPRRHPYRMNRGRCLRMSGHEGDRPVLHIQFGDGKCYQVSPFTLDDWARAVLTYHQPGCLWHIHVPKPLVHTVTREPAFPRNLRWKVKYLNLLP